MEPVNLPEPELRKISSRRTWFYKAVFPVFWFGIVALILGAVSIGCLQTTHSVPAAALFVPVFMLVLGYVLMKKLIFDMADEVWEGHDFLKVRFGDAEEQIPFANIVNVNYMMMNPPRATLTLRDPCRFGKEIAFSPLTSWADFFASLHFRNTVTDQLIQKIDAQRQRR